MSAQVWEPACRRTGHSEIEGRFHAAGRHPARAAAERRPRRQRHLCRGVERNDCHVDGVGDRGWQLVWSGLLLALLGGRYSFRECFSLCMLQRVHTSECCGPHLPGCLAGYQVAKDAFGGAFMSEQLSIGADRWKLGRGAHVQQAEEGRTADLRGAAVRVTSYVNGEPRTQLVLLHGFQKLPLGTGVQQLAAVIGPDHCSALTCCCTCRPQHRGAAVDCRSHKRPCAATHRADVANFAPAGIRASSSCPASLRRSIRHAQSVLE